MSKWDIDRALDSVKTEIDSLERFRREVLAKRDEGTKWMSFVALGAVVLGGLTMIMSGSPAGLLVGLAVGLIGALIVHQTYFGNGAARYRASFKADVLSPLIRAVEPGMTYSHEQGISKAVFKESGLFSNDPDRYASEDLIHGMLGETKVMFSEVHAEEKHTSTDSKGNTSTRWETVFRGIFFVADFHKEFRSPVSVMPDVAERHFGWFGQKLQKLGGNLQKMENPEFEKMFVVRGADAIEARYILTPSMQERLVELRRRLGDEIRVVFRDSHVWLAIPNKSNWFEGDLFKSVGDRAQASLLLGQLRSCFQIVEELDLNTRIWTKR